MQDDHPGDRHGYREAEIGTPLGLVVDSGRLTGQKFVLGASRVFIGRDQENEIVLPDFSVSPRHAGIQRWNNQWWITDLRSATGIYVNGRRLLKPAVISPGDVIQLGNIRFKVLGTSPKARRTPTAAHKGNRHPGPQRPPQSAPPWLFVAPLLIALVVVFWLIGALGKSRMQSAVPTASPRTTEPLVVLSPAPRAISSPSVTPPVLPTLSLSPIVGQQVVLETPPPSSRVEAVPGQTVVPNPMAVPSLVTWGEPEYRSPRPQDLEFSWAFEREGKNIAWAFTIVLTPTAGTSDFSGPFLYARGKDGALRQVTTYVQTPLSAERAGVFLAFCREDEYIAKAVLYKDGVAFHYDFQDARPSSP